MSSGDVKLVYGAAEFFVYKPEEAAQKIPAIFNTLDRLGIKNLDTARAYGASERLLGEYGGPKRYIVDTKHPMALEPGNSGAENVYEFGMESLKRLQTNQVDIYYLHSPEVSTPIESTLEGIDKLYKRGAFKRFGLSNFTPEQVKEIYNIAKEKYEWLPSVFQGNYNAFSRIHETTLFPLLRELKIAFYAYSPVAGGVLVKSREQFEAKEGRLGHPMMGPMYSSLYGGSKLVDSLDDWGHIAEKEGISRGELAYRWIRYHSALSAEHDDAVIFGASGVERIEQTVNWLKGGPLSKEAVNSINVIWEKIKSEAPTNNADAFLKMKNVDELRASMADPNPA